MIYRMATRQDAFALAELLILAGDGLFAFLLEEFAPESMLAGLMARTLRQESGGTSWRQCSVAEDNGVIVGMVNAFPAAWLQEEERDILPPDRVQVLEGIEQVQDWQSFLLNGVAVREAWRRQGIGRRLVDWAIEQGQASGSPRVTANVWQDNTSAFDLLHGEGFRVGSRVAIPPHPALPHVGGCLLMVKDLAAEAPVA